MKSVWPHPVLLIAPFLFSPAFACADEEAQVFAYPELESGEYVHYRGSVSHVFDGDTIRLLVNESCENSSCPNTGDKVKIRLGEIDTPESDQPHGKRAESALRGAIGGKDIHVLQTDVDQYGRAVGELYYKDAWVNGWLVQQGHAWAYPEFVIADQLFSWQEEAKSEEAGLWRAESPVKPWVWRQK